MKINLDDPNLTAFALGELSGPERAAMEKAVASSPEAQRFVSETQQLSRLLKSEYTADWQPGSAHSPSVRRTPEQRPLWSSGRQWGSLAAAFAIFAVLGVVAVSVILRYGGNVPHKHRMLDLTYLPPVEAISEAPNESLGQNAASQQPELGLPGLSHGTIRIPPPDNPFLPAAASPLSTFPMGVETGSFSKIQHFVDSGSLPPKDAVFVDQMINYFTYDYRQPEADNPFSIDLDATACPWDPSHRLLRVGLKGRHLPTRTTIAKGVNARVEFNPRQVSSYRLIGYENWNPQRDSKSDQEEGSEIGSGHTVTVLYEIVPASTGMNNSFVKPPADLLKYQRPRSAVGPPKEMDEQLSKEMATVRLRYKRPNSEATETIEGSFVDNGSNFQDAAPDLKFAAAVAEFGMILRDSPYKGTGTLGAVVEWAREGKGRDLGGTRAGFIELVRRTEALKGGEG